jgi:hypothetical protein
MPQDGLDRSAKSVECRSREPVLLRYLADRLIRRLAGLLSRELCQPVGTGYILDPKSKIYKPHIARTTESHSQTENPKDKPRFLT